MGRHSAPRQPPTLSGLAQHPAVALAAAAVLALAATCIVIAAGQDQGTAKAAPLPAATFSTVPAALPTASIDRARSASYPPSSVIIAALNVSAGFVPVSVTAGSLTIPASVHTIGWNSAGGQVDATTGTVLMASHVDYVGQGHGVFYNLSQLQAGALIVITDQQARPTLWQVTGVTATAKAKLDQSIFNASGARRLVLVTCGGNVRHGDYDQNVLVYARPVTDDATAADPQPSQPAR